MDLEQIACTIIANAGDARSNCLAALDALKEKDHEGVQSLMRQADLALQAAHDEHTKLLTRDARGEEVTLSLLLVHASDHLASAEVIRDLAETIINLFEMKENV